MTPDNLHDDSLDPVIRNRRYTGKPAVDALNSTVPQADDERRDALEQRLMARVPEGKAPGKNRPMIHNAALQGAYETPRRFQISTSLLLTAAVGMLFATVLVFSSFNRPPSEESPWAVAPVNQDQDATAVPVVTVTPTAFEATATLIPFEGQGAVPTTVPLTAVPHDPDSSLTATPVPFAGDVRNNAITHTVQSGDTFVGIAARYGIDVNTLIRLNNLDLEAPLVLGRELVVSVLETTATPVPFVFPSGTPSPVPMDVVMTVTAVSDIGPDWLAPPAVWLPRDTYISEAGSSGLLVVLTPDRLQPMNNMQQPLTDEMRVNLYTSIGIPSGTSIISAFYPVAMDVPVKNAGEFGTVVYVTLEQGIVLNWLFNDTRALIYYEVAGQ